MNQMAFKTPAELVKYVNDESIPQANIVMLMEKDGMWYLFWFTP